MRNNLFLLLVLSIGISVFSQALNPKRNLKDDINVMKGGHLHMNINLANLPKGLYQLLKNQNTGTCSKNSKTTVSSSSKKITKKGGKATLKFKKKITIKKPIKAKKIPPKYGYRRPPVKKIKKITIKKPIKDKKLKKGGKVEVKVTTKGKGKKSKKAKKVKKGGKVKVKVTTVSYTHLTLPTICSV